MKLLRHLKLPLWKLRFFIKTNAPIWVMFDRYRLNITHKISNLFSAKGRRYVQKKHEFKRLVKDRLKLDYDFFPNSIQNWLRVFDKEKIYDKHDLNCLEIGSWQGESAFFTLNELSRAKLTCVDTWEGSDEHRDGTSSSHEVLSEIERTFDSNLSEFEDRLYKYKGTSFSYFNNEFEPSKFDLIYVDGSHHSEDVIVDAVKAFEMLKVGGLLIFDDYFYEYYDNAMENPAGAINFFLRLKKHQLKIISFNYQVIVKKTANSSRLLKAK